MKTQSSRELSPSDTPKSERLRRAAAQHEAALVLHSQAWERMHRARRAGDSEAFQALRDEMLVAWDDVRTARQVKDAVARERERA